MSVGNVSVNQLGFVGILPYLGQGHCTVESEEDAEGQGHLLDDHPGHVAEEFNLHRGLLDLLDLECVDHPDGQVADQ